jgi:pilus assembly protein CpaB
MYLGGFLLLSLVAGAIYYTTTREVSVVVAHGDLQLGSLITDNAVSLKRISPNAVPAGSAHHLADVVGKYVAWPVLDGHYVPLKALSHDRVSLIAGGLHVPAGFRAISVPVTAVEAVGGALRPGDYVDILATPKSQAPGASPAPAVMLGQKVLLLGLRTDQGQPLDATGGPGTVHGLNFANNRIAAIVVAVAPEDEARYAAATATSSFTIVLNL